MQRMLAREQGTAPLPAAPRAKKPAGGAGKAAAPAPAPGPQKPRSNLRPISDTLLRRRRRRRGILAAAVVVAALAVSAVTGLLGSSLAMLGDAADSVSLYLDRSGGSWPAATGIETPLRVEPLAGGMVVMDSRDVAVYSAYGSKIRTLQPGYARPALAVGNTRFVIYNRAGTELQVESRTQTLYKETFANGILLCAMSGNGTLAVVTESSRYAAELQVFDAGFDLLYNWRLTQNEGVPVALAFAGDNRRFAAGTLGAQEGRIASTVYFMDTAAEQAGPDYAADAGALLLRLDWLTSTRVLAVFDTYTALLDADTGGELARYHYNGATLQGAALSGRNTALLLSERTGAGLVILDDSLTELARVDAGQAQGVAGTGTAVYLLESDAVRCLGLDGAERWAKGFAARPVAVLDAAQTLVFYGGTAEVLTPPGG